MTKTLSILVSLLFCFVSAAQNFNSPKMDSLLSVLDDNNQWMGSICVSQNGKLLYSKAIGWSDAENKIKNDPTSAYRIGSITKMFTSVLVLKAIEDGRLKLETKLSEYFPAIQHAEDITISMLLQHRSGITNFTDTSAYLTYNTLPIDEAGLIQHIKSGGSVFRPDSKAEYSNSNYALLTFILEKVYKKPYATLLETYITGPLKLRKTYVGGRINTALKESNSYTHDGSYSKMSETDMSVPRGAGNMVSTAEDLCIFITKLFDGKIIKTQSLAKMKEIRDGYGRGIFEYPLDNKTGYGHTGGIDGFSSMLGIIPDDKIAVALLSNGGHYPNNEIIIAAFNCFYGKPFELPDYTSVNVEDKILQTYTGIYKSSQLPLDIEISVNGKKLQARATGQSSFLLEAKDERTFSFIPSGIILEFIPGEGKMILKQGGGVYNYKKE